MKSVTDKISQGNQTGTQNTYMASEVGNVLKLQKIGNIIGVQNNELELKEYLREQHVDTDADLKNKIKLLTFQRQ